MPIKLAIGCHSYLFGEGLKKLFEDDNEISVIGIFDEGTDLEKIIKLNPDVVITDFHISLNLPEDSIIDTQVKILLIGERTTWDTIADKQIVELVSRGVVGVLPPSADSCLLKKAIKAVFSGELWIDRKTIKTILSCKSFLDKKVDLTRREKEIVFHICQGYRNKEIAQKLDISEQTVKSHCNRIYKKLEVSDRLQLAIHSYRIWPEFNQGIKH
ncbi:MAG: response regulator transcription factor [Nitrospira sp.]|nr:response regulator transcription factor [Nitrospira sp.]